MLKITSQINNVFSNGLYCEKYSVIIHNSTGYVNASDICVRYSINFDIWVMSPIYHSISVYIREHLDLRPVNYYPDGESKKTHGLYIHPLLLPYLILEAGNTDFLRADFSNLFDPNLKQKEKFSELGEKFAKFLTVFKRVMKEFEPILKDLGEEIKPFLDDCVMCDNDSMSSHIHSSLKNPYAESDEDNELKHYKPKYTTDSDESIPPLPLKTNIDLYKKMSHVLKPNQKHTESDDDSSINTNLEIPKYEKFKTLRDLYSKTHQLKSKIDPLETKSHSFDSEPLDTELLRQKIKRQIRNLNRNY